MVSAEVGGALFVCGGVGGIQSLPLCGSVARTGEEKNMAGLEDFFVRECSGVAECGG